MQVELQCMYKVFFLLNLQICSEVIVISLYILRGLHDSRSRPSKHLAKRRVVTRPDENMKLRAICLQQSAPCPHEK